LIRFWNGDGLTKRDGVRATIIQAWGDHPPVGSG